MNPPKPASLRFDDFVASQIAVTKTTIFLRRAGSGPPLLLLHGFPETHLMWRDVAPQLAKTYTVICADLRGYGQSGCPKSAVDHGPYSKRTLADDLLEVMSQLGFETFSVAGHDRGGRVAYRMALDHPARVTGLAVLDIIPSSDAWQRADHEFAKAFWPWSLLMQSAPLPETLIISAPAAVVDDALGGWGSPAGVFPDPIRNAYIDALRDPAHVHAICEEYRAAASVDVENDKADQHAGQQIKCPVLVLWSKRGPLNRWYASEGGPLGIWRKWAPAAQGSAIDGGHFFPEELPELTGRLLGKFFAP